MKTSLLKSNQSSAVRPESDGHFAQKESPSTNHRKPLPITAEQRLALIAEAAYFRSQRQGGTSESDIDRWLAAEREIDCLLPYERP
jgi:hypothetical protein